MSRKLLAATSLLTVAAVASAEIADVRLEPQYEGYLSDGTTYVFSYDLTVEIVGEDAWTVAGGPSVGAPWASLQGGIFYQSPENDTNPANPDLFDDFPDSEFTSFYTTHLGFPNTPNAGVSPGFGGGFDTPTGLEADWFLPPDGNYYPGSFTIARATVIPDDPDNWLLEVGVQVGSLETWVELYTIVVPEPMSLMLLALGGLALFRRR